jgi:hypothetical protein
MVVAGCPDHVRNFLNLIICPVRSYSWFTGTLSYRTRENRIAGDHGLGDESRDPRRVHASGEEA